MQIRGKGERQREGSKYESKWFLKTDQGTSLSMPILCTPVLGLPSSPPGAGALSSDCHWRGECTYLLSMAARDWGHRQVWTSTLCLRSTLEPRTLDFAPDHPSLETEQSSWHQERPVLISLSRAGEDSEYGRTGGLILMLHGPFLSRWGASKGSFWVGFLLHLPLICWFPCMSFYWSLKILQSRFNLVALVFFTRELVF